MTYAIGGDENLAKASGVKIWRYKVLAFMFSGFLASSAIYLTVQLGLRRGKYRCWNAVPCDQRGFRRRDFIERRPRWCVLGSGAEEVCRAIFGVQEMLVD